MMSEQIKLFGDSVGFGSIRKHNKKVKRNWENAFQKWSDENGMSNGTESYGSCGYGSMCDWCKDNSYGRPCVRALNAMCREKGIAIDYSDKDFCKVWRGAEQCT